MTSWGAGAAGVVRAPTLQRSRTLISCPQISENQRHPAQRAQGGPVRHRAHHPPGAGAWPPLGERTCCSILRHRSPQGASSRPSVPSAMPQVPYGLANYLLGLPEALDFWRYMGASIIGIIPSVVVVSAGEERTPRFGATQGARGVGRATCVDRLGALHTMQSIIFGRNIKGLSDMLQGESVPAGQLAVNLVGALLFPTWRPRVNLQCCNAAYPSAVLCAQVSLISGIVLLLGGWWYAKRVLDEVRAWVVSSSWWGARCAGCFGAPGSQVVHLFARCRWRRRRRRSSGGGATPAAACQRPARLARHQRRARLQTKGSRQEMQRRRRTTWSSPYRSWRRRWTRIRIFRRSQGERGAWSCRVAAGGTSSRASPLAP